MKMISIPRLSGIRRSYYDNTLDIFNAEVWAKEALLQLQGDLVLGNLAYRDFSNQVAKFGDVVNIAQPGTFNARRKSALCEDIKIQDGSADSFAIALDQFLYVSFKICDGEENRGMMDLVQTFLTPAVRALAEKIDLVLAGQHVRFWDHSAGHLQGLDKTNVADLIIELGQVMDLNRVPSDNRQLLLASTVKSSLLQTQQFVDVNRSGDNRALRKGFINELFGFNLWSSHTQPAILARNQLTSTFLVNNAAGYPAGTTAITVDTPSTPAITVGMFVTVAGDATPQRVTATNGTTTLTISPGLRYAVADNAVISGIRAGAINKASGYAATTVNPRRVGYAGYLMTDGWSTTIPQKGQPVAFGTTALEKYTIIEVSDHDDDGVALAGGSFMLMLDRPLETSLADNATINLAPPGSYNFAFNENALAAAFRPLPKPRTGSLSSVQNYKGIPLRVTITYDGKQQAHIVTVDTLMGVGVYDENVGAVLFG